MNDMPSLPSQRKESVLGPSSLRVREMLCEFSRVSPPESKGSRRNAGSDSDEPRKSDAGRCFEGREAVELSILMGYYK